MWTIPLILITIGLVWMILKDYNRKMEERQKATFDEEYKRLIREKFKNK